MRTLPVVAIDGPSGSGKSTAARGLAKALGYTLIDTGALYRAVAWLADSDGVEWDAAEDLARLLPKHTFYFNSDGDLLVDGELVGDVIRTARVSNGASIVAVHPEVRAALQTIQRKLAENGGVVLEGRDIGTVVFPDAEVKFYLTASADVRAKRRFAERKRRGEETTLEQVVDEQDRRDHADRSRPISPLKVADDAVEIRSDDMGADEVIESMRKRVSDVISGGGSKDFL